MKGFFSKVKGFFMPPYSAKKIIWYAVIVLVIAAIVVAAAIGFKLLNNPQKFFVQNTQINASKDEDADKDGDKTAGLGKRVNVLVMGYDMSAYRLTLDDREDFRTDTMMLISVDIEHGKIDIVSTPRDIFTTVRNATGNLYKLNSAAYFGGGLTHDGMMNACGTVSDLLGVPVDYYVGVDMDGLVALVNAMGGVYYNVDIPAKLIPNIDEEGYQHLDGWQVLEYCRVRKTIGTDIDRQKRQQNMVMTIMRQLKDESKLKDIPAIYSSVKDYVHTNLNIMQIGALALSLKDIDLENGVHTHMLKGEYHWAYNVHYYLLDQQAKVDLVKEVFGVDAPFDREHDMEYVLKDSASKGYSKYGPQDEENELIEGEGEAEPDGAEPENGETVQTPDPDNGAAGEETEDGEQDVQQGETPEPESKPEDTAPEQAPDADNGDDEAA